MFRLVTTASAGHLQVVATDVFGRVPTGITQGRLSTLDVRDSLDELRSVRSRLRRSGESAWIEGAA